MTTRTARCACGRVEVTVEGEPLLVYVCHCDFCQRRSGNVFIASAQFAEEQVISITGETTRYNGLEVDGVGAVRDAEGINYHFCSVCGSSMYHHNVMPHDRTAHLRRITRGLHRGRFPAAHGRVLHEASPPVGAGRSGSDAASRPTRSRCQGSIQRR